MRHALATSLAVLLAGCAPSLIPGTDIKDTPESRKIIDVIGSYRAGLEGRNVERIMKLVAKGFFENSGTPEGGDDYDVQGLEARLKTWAEQTRAVRASIEVKSITFEDGRARVIYFYDVNYQIPGTDGVLLWKRDTDTKEMTLVKEGGVWRIQSGI